MSQQLELLQRDSDTLQMYITECREKGKTSIVPKLEKKLNFLKSKLSEMESLAA